VAKQLAAGDVMTRATNAVYVYCVVHAARRPSIARPPAGMPGSGRLEVHATAPSLWIVTAAVPLDVYGPSRLESRLRDLDWVAAAAVAHEAVVECFAKAPASTVIPMKLFTMFSSLDRAISDLEARKGALRAAIRRIAGAEEWGVRVFRMPGTAAPPAGAPSSGAAFLRARQQARAAAATARLAAADAVAVAYNRLRRHARDARVRDARREPGTNPPILDAAFLVPATARTRFKAETRRQRTTLARTGADLVLTGPWPAYNFVVSGDAP
jgi:hypothetical protein